MRNAGPLMHKMFVSFVVNKRVDMCASILFTCRLFGGERFLGHYPNEGHYAGILFI